MTTLADRVAEALKPLPPEIAVSATNQQRMHDTIESLQSLLREVWEEYEGVRRLWSGDIEYWRCLVSDRDKRIEAQSERLVVMEGALQQSVELQGHYAMLLNMYDGGRRIEFKSADEWLARLAVLAAKEIS